MNIRTLGTLALSAIVFDSMLFTSLAYAERSYEFFKPNEIPQTIHTKLSVKNTSPTFSGAVSTRAEAKVAKVANLKVQPKQSAEDKDLDLLLPKLPDDSEDSKIALASLQGQVTYVDLSPHFSETVHRLTKVAVQREPEYEKTAKAVDHFRTKVQRTVRFTKDAVNYMYPYRGFSMSMEGSRVLLDKKQKLSNLWIAELCKQRYWDEMHPKVMAQIMQIAMGLGIENPEDANKAVQKGVNGLSALVGEETAQTTLQELAEWKDQLNVPETVFQQSPWDCETSQKVYQNALKTSAEGDPLIHDIYHRVKKFDHGKIANFAASMIEANLSAATILSGNPFASLAAEGINTAFVMSTGGPEENKILNELYYGRRLEIRRKRISDETQLAISNYEKALLTRNQPQLAMSEVVLAELVGPERIAATLERNPINDFTMTAPIELAQKDSK
jgi:hypothetical protein